MVAARAATCAIPLSKWLVFIRPSLAGFDCPLTAWRFRKRGWLQTVNIAGRQYITSEGIAKFKQRAAAGDFAKEHKTPKRIHS